MKIRQIPAFRPGSIQDGQNLKISPTLQLLFGFVDADTSAVRNGIRNFLYGNEPLSRLNSDRTEFEVVLKSGVTVGTRFVDGIRMSNPEVMPEWDRIIQEIDLSTFRSFFEMNFGNTESSGSQLCFQLNRRFNAPFGNVGNDELNEQRVESLKAEIASTNRIISKCRSDLEQLRSRLEELESRQDRPYVFDAKQRQALSNRIANLEDKLSQQKDAACRLDEEIELTLHAAVPSQPSPQPSSQYSALRNSTRALSEQIQKVDSQIDRWKTIKLDVAERLTQLRGDLGGSKVSEFDEMIDDIRIANQIGESKLLDLMESLPGDDRRLSEYRELLELNHQICDGLTSIQDRWRKDIADSEIESLNRCSKELDGYLDQLARKRNGLEANHAGVTTNKSCQCKSHMPGIRVDVHRVEEMKIRQAELLAEIEIAEKSLQKAQQELLALDEFSNAENEIEFVRLRIQECNQEHSDQQDKKDRLLNQLRLCMEAESENSFLVRKISGYLSELTAGQYQEIFLDDNGHDMILVNSDGVQEAFKDSDFVTRNRVRMAVSLGCSKLLANAGYSVPLVWEDPFVAMDTSQIEVVTRVVQEYSRTVGQVLLLTNNQFIKQLYESRSIPCLDLPDRYSGDMFPSTQTDSGRRLKDTEQSFRSRFVGDRRVEYSSITNWSKINREFDLAAMDQYGTERRKPTEPHARTESYSSRRVEDHSQRSRRYQNSSQQDDIQELENLKYYLEFSSRVEAAPTIGPKTAEKLEKIGICTVSDLLENDAFDIAEQLGQRRIKSDDVDQWQKQALLVCEVPNLRGHDAQLLVACGINNAVQLAGMEPEPLYEIIGPFAKSKDGKKLLRGSTQPDLEEVQNWVRWARYKQRNRQAA